MADDGQKFLKGFQSEDDRITAPSPVAKNNRPDGDAPKPPKNKPK